MELGADKEHDARSAALLSFLSPSAIAAPGAGRTVAGVIAIRAYLGSKEGRKRLS